MPHPFRFSVTITGTAPTDVAATACRAEALGYSTVSIADHLDGQPAPLLALLAAAQATTALRIGTLVLSNDYHHPAILAKELTTLDQLSGGRLEVGLGAGWMLDDYERAGIVHDRAGLRVDRLREAVTVLDGLLSGTPTTFHGAHYTIRDLTNAPPPVQQPRPPLLLAGGGRRVLTLAGRVADIVGVNPTLSAGVIDDRAGPSATPAATDDKIGWIRDGAGSRFEAIELQTRVHLAAVLDGDDERTALARALAPGLGLTPEDALASPHALVGTIDQCVATIETWRERWGISYIGLSGDVMEAMAPVVARLTGH